MAVMRILRMGNPLLAKPSSPVEDPSSSEIQVLVENMIETMRSAAGIGLAAPQVGVSLRVVVYYLPADRDDLKSAGRDLTILINPRVTVLDADEVTGLEACLSLPGLQGSVPRPKRVQVNADTLGSKRLCYEAEGYHARVVCHECDHLEGILYPMRMRNIESLAFVDEINRFRASLEH